MIAIPSYVQILPVREALGEDMVVSFCLCRQAVKLSYLNISCFMTPLHPPDLMRS